MDVLVERCAGIDIGKDEVVACVRTPAASGRGRQKRTRTFSSFTGSLEVMADWFAAEGVTTLDSTELDFDGTVAALVTLVREAAGLEAVS